MRCAGYFLRKSPLMDYIARKMHFHPLFQATSFESSQHRVDGARVCTSGCFPAPSQVVPPFFAASRPSLTATSYWKAHCRLVY